MKTKIFTTIIKVAWQRALAFRFSAAMYRIGHAVEILSLILMWSVIYNKQATIKGYSLNEMITYVLIGNLIEIIVRNWLVEIVARDIRDGALSQFLIKPISYLQYIISREIGKISLALFFSLAMQGIIMFFFVERLVVNTDWRYLVVIFLMILFAFITEMLLSCLIGMMAFWVTEVDGIFASITKIKNLFMGSIFPLSLLPSALVKLSLALPFAYSFFIPAQLYLKKFSLETGLYGLLIQVIWIFVLYNLVRFTWSRGLRHYEGVGI